MKNTWRPITAGVINLVSGTFFLLGGVVVLCLIGQPIVTYIADYTMYSMGLTGTPSPSFITTTTAILATSLLVPGVLSIVGGICSLKRNAWGMALAGSISTFVSLTPLGIPAIAFIALSKKEFA